MDVHAWLLGLGFALPGLFVLYRAVRLGSDVADSIDRAVGPLGRTLLLSFSVAATASVVGTALAWLIVRSNLPGRRFVRVLGPLPLVLPSFVGAAAMLAAVAPGGVLDGALATIGIDNPRLRGFWPAWILLSSFTYPYVLLPVAARLASLSPAAEESARVLGRSAFGAFVSVTLPSIRSAVASSGLLVFLYTVSEFGAVQLLGYDTLTRVIFASRLSDRGTSFVAAALLVLVAVAVSGLERAMRRPAHADQLRASYVVERARLGRWTAPALAAVWSVLAIGLIIPLVSLATWATRAVSGGDIDAARLLEASWNTALAGLLTSVVAVLVVLPLALAVVRHRSRRARSASVAVVSGFAVPGLVIALALVFFTLNTPGVGWLYQTLPLLIAAYVIHFGSQALGASEDAVLAVPDAVRESGLLLEASAQVRARRLDLPLMRPSLLSGGGLVLLSTVKELPATLLLAPIGFRTLATDVWGSYEEGFLPDVGLAALVLVVLSGTLTWFLVLSRAEALRAH